jgi:anti-sigma factor RsiW
MDCRQFAKQVGDYVNGTLDEKLVRSAQEHVSTCERCASLARELENTSRLVSSMERASAPADFEERLRARLASQRSPAAAPRSDGVIAAWLRAIRDAFAGVPVHGRRLALVPAVAGLLLCAVILASVFMFGRDRNVETPDADWAFIEACQAQHASFAAANPLADDSAIILRERARELADDL